MSDQPIDSYFEKILTEMISLATKTTERCTQEVLKLSEQCLDEKAHKTVCKFYDLYFSNKFSETNEKFNKEIDDIIDQAMEQNLEASEIKLKTSKEEEENRLRLSELQKELESLINLDQGMKEQLAPVLSSMQFEDSSKQRLQHIAEGWKQIIENHCIEESTNFKMIESLMSSTEETAEFYHHVLKQEPPKQDNDQSNSVLFF